MRIDEFESRRSPAIGSGFILWPRGEIGRRKGLLQVNKHLKTNLVVLSDISMGKYQFPFKEQSSRLGSVPPTKSLGPQRPCRFDSGRGYKEII